MISTPRQCLAFVEHYRELSALEAMYRPSLDPLLRRELPPLRERLDAEAADLATVLGYDVEEEDREAAEKERDVRRVTTPEERAAMSARLKEFLARIPDARPAAAMPRCPKCGSEMQGGAPHGPWPVQYECRVCGHVVVPPSAALAVELAAIVAGLAAVNFAATPEMAPLAELIIRAKNAVGFAGQQQGPPVESIRAEFEQILAAAEGGGR